MAPICPYNFPIQDDLLGYKQSLLDDLDSCHFWWLNQSTIQDDLTYYQHWQNYQRIYIDVFKF